MIDICADSAYKGADAEKASSGGNVAKKLQRKTTRPSEVQRALDFLLKDMRPEDVASRLRITVYTVYRWRKGTTGKPHPGHLTTIRELVKSERERRKRKSVGAAAA